ncbi:hypothetical protein M0R45_019487 [Rubus argutus]|uniref:Uncharacterized protein n=1 Tax=Rubus argutus TaxID=59490 RepID=A0AAW1X7G9_RUBAR
MLHFLTEPSPWKLLIPICQYHSPKTKPSSSSSISQANPNSNHHSSWSTSPLPHNPTTKQNPYLLPVLPVHNSTSHQSAPTPPISIVHHCCHKLHQDHRGLPCRSKDRTRRSALTIAQARTPMPTPSSQPSREPMYFGAAKPLPPTRRPALLPVPLASTVILKASWYYCRRRYRPLPVVASL